MCARQDKLDGALVRPQLGHHVRVLVQQAQRREPGPVPLAEEERDAAHDKDLDVVGAGEGKEKRRQMKGKAADSAFLNPRTWLFIRPASPWGWRKGGAGPHAKVDIQGAH